MPHDYAKQRLAQPARSGSNTLSGVLSTDFIALLSALIAAGGLIFVGVQIRLLLRQMRVQSHQATYAHQQQVDALLFHRLDLKAIIEGRRVLPTENDPIYEDVMAATELVVTLFEHVWVHGQSMSPDIAAQWHVYSRGMAASDAFAAYFARTPDGWYSPDFLAHLRCANSLITTEPRSTVNQDRTSGPARATSTEEPIDRTGSSEHETRDAPLRRSLPSD